MSYIYKGVIISEKHQELTVDEQSSYKLVSVEGLIVGDIGANLGMSSLYFLNKGAKHIYAYEPDPRCIELLKMNVDTRPVDVFEVAIVASDYNHDTTDLYLSKTHPVANTLLPIRGREKVAVKTLKLCDEVRLHDIQYLKIDIEGYELFLLNDILSLPESVLGIVMEIHYGKDRTVFSKFFSEMSGQYFVVKPPKYTEGGWNRCTVIYERIETR
jgi:FkbM family methyltransferase